SNGWIRYHPGLTLPEVFARALDVLGPGRLLFGTDSSFFPRGWQRTVFEAQRAITTDLGLEGEAAAAVFGGNLGRVFPL
ncbi:MAG: amidohydrolase family protein, partial [Vicinamibacterales bacterium]